MTNTFADLMRQAAEERRLIADTSVRVFGARVKRKREALVWTQEQLAELVGLSRSSISNIEAGRQDTPLSNAAVIAAALGEPLGALVGERA